MEGPPNGSATTVEYYGSSRPQYHHCLPAIRGSNHGMQQPPYGDNNYSQRPHPEVSSSIVTLRIAANPPIDPALATAVGRAPPAPRPMPVMPQPAIHSPCGQGPLTPDSDSATRVVGDQSRRAIQPSGPKKPAVPATGSAEAENQIPQKDADGKVPCPHCTKTFIQAKRIKRHLLTHTGERSYRCVLCRCTFARSDTLKRHFQTCSKRRGNPTGATHLSHPEARVKRNAAEGVNDVQWIASPSENANSYPGWTAFDSALVSGHSGVSYVGPS